MFFQKNHTRFIKIFNKLRRYIVINPNILDVPEETKEEEKPVETDSGEKKVIIQEPDSSSSDVTTSSETKKITL